MRTYFGDNGPINLPIFEKNEKLKKKLASEEKNCALLNLLLANFIFIKIAKISFLGISFPSYFDYSFFSTGIVSIVLGVREDML